MGSLRSAEQWTRYEKYKADGGLRGECPLCAEPRSIESFDHWRIIHSEFPYDRIARVHHMVVPKRHVDERGLSTEEKEELGRVKEKYIYDNYEFVIEASLKTKSIPEHFHLHLIIVKD
jgi:diadenosine tetraphosphate (Ap4A) HIT family hydrolase